MTKIKEVIRCFQEVAPFAYQESYDNAGLITGSPEWEVSNVLTCLDCIESVVDEAIALNCNLIVAHHPIVFQGLKSITGKNYIERVVIKAIQHRIAILAVHTNLDSVLDHGVNDRIARRLGLQSTTILSPKVDQVRILIPNKPSTTSLNWELFGKHHRIKNVDRIDLNDWMKKLDQKAGILESECIIIPDDKPSGKVGAGVIGNLSSAVPVEEFLGLLKERLHLACIRYTKLVKRSISRVAVCGGAGSFLLKQAIRAGADVLVSADFKYHQFFDAEEKIIIADIGHYESEQFTIPLLQDIIMNKFSNFAVHCTKVITNPIKYYS